MCGRGQSRLYDLRHVHGSSIETAEEWCDTAGSTTPMDTERNPTAPGQHWVTLVIAVILIGIVAAAAYFWNAGDMQPIGGGRDEHGCLIAAGYAWCEARQACERPFERYCTAATPKAATFVCDDGKTIDATFYPSDDQYVDLVLSDDRALSVPRALSASGARYARADESLVFWNKGDTAFITEHGTTTFSNCTTSADS